MYRRSMLGFMAVCALMFTVTAFPARAADQQVCTDVIKLKFLEPARVMFMLGLYSMEDALRGRHTGWTKGQPVADKSSLIPEGIEFVMPYAPDRSLIVKGDREGIDDLKALIGKLDTKPRQITLTVDVWKLTPEQVKSVGFAPPSGHGKISSCGERVSAELRARLAELRSAQVASLTVTTENNVPATIAVDAGFKLRRMEFMMVPRINNADQSITMLLKLSILPGPDMSTDPSMPETTDSDQLQTTKRVARGEGVIFYDSTGMGGASTLAVIAPRVVD